MRDETEMGLGRDMGRSGGLGEKAKVRKESRLEDRESPSRDEKKLKNTQKSQNCMGNCKRDPLGEGKGTRRERILRQRRSLDATLNPFHAIKRCNKVKNNENHKKRCHGGQYKGEKGNSKESVITTHKVAKVPNEP